MPFDALYTKIEQAKLKCRLKDPYLADLLNHWVIELSETHKTAATDGLKIYYGRSFIKNQTTDEILFVLLHELMHILLDHLPRRHGRHPKKFNIACDIVVNDLLAHHGFDSGNLPIIHGSAFKIRGHRTHAEQVYDQLPSRTKTQGFDDHSLWDMFDGPAVKSILERIQHMPHSSKLLKRVLPNTQKKPWPSLREMLSQFFVKKTPDYTFERIDPRFSDVYLPSFQPHHEVMEDMWVVIDVSGSMEKELLTRLYQGFMDAFSQYASLNVQLSFFSTVVTPPQPIASVDDFKEAFDAIRSTGGTDFSEIFMQFPKLFKTTHPSVTIIVTDGFGNPPDLSLDPGNETWWAITNSHPFKPHFGQRVTL